MVDVMGNDPAREVLAALSDGEVTPQEALDLLKAIEAAGTAREKNVHAPRQTGSVVDFAAFQRRLQEIEDSDDA